MKIVKVSAIPMSAPVPSEKRHRTDLGTKVKSDATLIRVETDSGLTGIGAALGSPPIVAAIVQHELAPEVVGEDPMFSERIYEKMYNGSRTTPALERGVTQADESRRRGVFMEAISGVDIAIWDVKAQALGIPLYQAMGAVRSSVRGYASGGWAPGDEAEVSHVSLNDGTVEGIRGDGFETLQFHPEAAPGPHDAVPFFDRIADACRSAPTYAAS